MSSKEELKEAYAYVIAELEGKGPEGSASEATPSDVSSVESGGELTQELRDREIEGAWSDAVQSESERRFMEELKRQPPEGSETEAELSETQADIIRGLVSQYTAGEKTPVASESEIFFTSEESDNPVERKRREASLSRNVRKMRELKEAAGREMKRIKKEVVEEMPLEDFKTSRVQERIRREMGRRRFRRFSENSGIASERNRFALGASVIIGALVLGDTIRRIYNFINVVGGSPRLEPPRPVPVDIENLPIVEDVPMLGLDPPPPGGDDGGDDDDPDPDDPADLPPDIPKWYKDLWNALKGEIGGIIGFLLGSPPLTWSQLLGQIKMQGLLTAKNAIEEINRIGFDGYLKKLRAGMERIDVSELQTERLALFTEIWKKINLENMPPEDKERLSQEVERLELHPPSFSFMGPQTHFEQRMRGMYLNPVPISKIDLATLRHDMYYQSKDPLSRLRGDEILLDDLTKLNIQKLNPSQRLLLGFTTTLFTVKYITEKIALNKYEGNASPFGKGLSGDPEYLGASIRDKRFEKIEKEFQRLKTIYDDAGLLFTMGDVAERTAARGITDTTKNEIKTFIENTKFLYSENPTRTPEGKLIDDDMGQVIMGNMTDAEKNIASINITDTMGAKVKMSTKDKKNMRGIIEDLKKDPEGIARFDMPELIQQVLDYGSKNDSQNILRILKSQGIKVTLANQSAESLRGQVQRGYEQLTGNKVQSIRFAMPEQGRRPDTTPLKTSEGLGVPTGEQPSEAPTGEQPSEAPTGEQPSEAPTGKQSSIDVETMERILKGKKKKLKESLVMILSHEHPELGINKGNIKDFTLGELNGKIKHAITLREKTEEATAQPTSAQPSTAPTGDKLRTIKGIPTTQPTGEQPTTQPTGEQPTAQPPTAQRWWDSIFGTPTAQAPTAQAPTAQAPTAQPPTSAPPPTAQAPTTQMPSGDIGQLTNSINNLIKVMAVDTSGIGGGGGEGGSGDPEDMEAFVPYLSAQMDNPDSKKTLEEDVIVSEKLQKESLENHGLFDFVPVDMWREKGNTFNSDRVLKEQLQWKTPLFNGYVNNSKLSWKKPKPKQTEVGRQIKRRYENANDAMYTDKNQPARIKQQADFLDLQSFREFYANRSYNPTRYKDGFNSYNMRIRGRA